MLHKVSYGPGHKRCTLKYDLNPYDGSGTREWRNGRLSTVSGTSEATRGGENCLWQFAR